MMTFNIDTIKRCELFMWRSRYTLAKRFLTFPLEKRHDDFPTLSILSSETPFRGFASPFIQIHLLFICKASSLFAGDCGLSNQGFLQRGTSSVAMLSINVSLPDRCGRSIVGNCNSVRLARRGQHFLTFNIRLLSEKLKKRKELESILNVIFYNNIVYCLLK